MTDTPPSPIDPADVPVIDAEDVDVEQSDTRRFSDPVLFNKLTPAQKRDLENREIKF